MTQGDWRREQLQLREVTSWSKVGTCAGSATRISQDRASEAR